jgi:hypothetical protein
MLKMLFFSPILQNAPVAFLIGLHYKEIEILIAGKRGDILGKNYENKKLITPLKLLKVNKEYGKI